VKGLIFTYLLTYGGAVLALFRPFAGFLIYVGFATLRPEFAWPWSVPMGNYSRTVAIALLAGWALNGFGQWKLGRGGAPIACLVAYSLWAVLSSSQAPDQILAANFLDRLWKIILPVVVGASLIKSVDQLKALAWVILLGHAYPAFEFNLDYLNGYNRLRYEGYAQMDNNCYAISLVSSAGIGVFLSMRGESRRERLLAAGSMAIIAHAVLISNSRGGMLGMIIVGLVSFFLLRKGWKEYSAFAAAILLTAIVTGPEVRERFASAFADKEERDASAQSRLDLWAACCDAIQKNPLLGVGPNHMPTLMPEYGFELGKEAHTLWLQVGAELGAPGLVLLLSFYVVTVLRLLPLARGAPTTDERLRLLARMVIASLCGFMVSAQFVSLEMLEPPYYVCLIGIGALKLGTPPRGRPRQAAGRPPTWPADAPNGNQRP